MSNSKVSAPMSRLFPFPENISERKEAFDFDSYRKRQPTPWHPHSTPGNYKYGIKPWQLFLPPGVWALPLNIIFPIWLCSLPLPPPVPLPQKFWPLFPSHLSLLPHRVELAQQSLAAVVLVLEDHVVLPNLQTGWKLWFDKPWKRMQKIGVFKTLKQD